MISPIDLAPAQLIDSPLTAPVLLLVRLRGPVKPDERDEPGLVVRSSVNKLDYIVRVEAQRSRIAVIVDYVPLHYRVRDGFNADHAQPDEQDPDVPQG